VLYRGNRINPQFDALGARGKGNVIGFEGGDAGRAINTLVVVGTSIRRDADGRYCLNDLHRAAVADGENVHTKSPSKFLRAPQTVALLRRIESEKGNDQNLVISPVVTNRGQGPDSGTYVSIEIAIHYGMWVSAAFELTVIRAFIGMLTAGVPSLLQYMELLSRIDQAAESASIAGRALRMHQLEFPVLLRIAQERHPQLSLQFDVPAPEQVLERRRLRKRASPAAKRLRA
jgi:hypothetical protein